MGKQLEDSIRLEIVKEIVTSRLTQNVELGEQELRAIMASALKQANAFIKLWNEMGANNYKPFTPNSFIKQ